MFLMQDYCYVSCIVLFMECDLHALYNMHIPLVPNITQHVSNTILPSCFLHHVFHAILLICLTQHNSRACHVTSKFATVPYRGSDSKFNPKEVPLLMNDYIQQFFGCRECAVNFGKGAGAISYDVTRRSDAILWLWRSHNRANHWLHKDPTEDPQQAKIQFPSYRVCALCRRARSYDLFDTKIVWDETNVLQYLKRFYAKARIKQSAKDAAANGR